MLGKQKCKILREIRERIAQENDIPFVTRECRYQGECRGTCPRCESELRYLEQQLAQRSALGKRVAVAALCAGMTLSAMGCGSSGPKSGGAEIAELSLRIPYRHTTPTPSPEICVTTGEVAWPEETEEPTPTPSATPYDREITGLVAWPDEPEDVIEPLELSGDVAWPEESHG